MPDHYEVYAPEECKRKVKEGIARAAINKAADKGASADPALSMEEAGK